MFLIGDLIARIKNGVLIKKESILVRKSKIIINILNILYNEGYINGYSFYNNLYIKIYLRYFEGKSIINNIFLVSKPGRRIYKSFYDILNMSKKGIFYIITTSSGLISNKDLYLNKNLNKNKYFIINNINILKKKYKNNNYIILHKNKLNLLINNDLLIHKNFIYLKNNSLFNLNINKYINKFFIEFKKNYIYNIYIWLNFFRNFNLNLYFEKKKKKINLNINLNYKNKIDNKIKKLCKTYKFIKFTNKYLKNIYFILYMYNYQNKYLYKYNFFIYKNTINKKYILNNIINKLKTEKRYFNIDYLINYYLDLHSFDILNNKNKYNFNIIFKIYRKKIQKNIYIKGGEIILGII